MNNPIIVAQAVKAPIEKVWRALTDGQEMKQWYFDTQNFEAKEGTQFQFEGGTETNKYVHLCTVQEVEAPHKISYTWRYKGYDGNTLVTFLLQERGDETLVTLTHEGIESFGTANPDFAKANFVAGWNHIIPVSLKEYVEQ